MLVCVCKKKRAISIIESKSTNWELCLIIILLIVRERVYSISSNKTLSIKKRHSQRSSIFKSVNVRIPEFEEDDNFKTLNSILYEETEIVPPINNIPLYADILTNNVPVQANQPIIYHDASLSLSPKGTTIVKHEVNIHKEAITDEFLSN